MNEPDILLGALSVVGLTLLSSLFVASEIAIVRVRPTELEELAAAGRTGAATARELARHLDETLAAIQLAITAIGLLLGWLGESQLAEGLIEHFGIRRTAAHALVAVAILGAITAFQVVLGELVPKAIALRHARRLALAVAPPLLAFQRLSAPAVWLLNGAAGLALRLLRVPPVAAAEHAHTIAELAMLLEETKQAGLVKEHHAEVVRRAFALAKSSIGDVMVPIERVEMIELRWDTERTLDLVTERAHTRLPVYDRERSNIVGTVNVKDLFHLYRLQRIVNVHDVMRKPVYVRTTDPVQDQLAVFLRQRIHIALVRNEKDEVVGLVTLEDLLEEIVGEIEDEGALAPEPPRAA